MHLYQQVDRTAAISSMFISKQNSHPSVTYQLNFLHMVVHSKCDYLHTVSNAKFNFKTAKFNCKTCTALPKTQVTKMYLKQNF